MSNKHLCTMCPKSIPSASELARHLLFHSGERSHKYGHCIPLLYIFYLLVFFSLQNFLFAHTCKRHALAFKWEHHRSYTHVLLVRFQMTCAAVLLKYTTVFSVHLLNLIKVQLKRLQMVFSYQDLTALSPISNFPAGNVNFADKQARLLV